MHKGSAVNDVIKARYVAIHSAFEKLLDLCKDGCLLGLGTGTTMKLFIELAFNNSEVLKVLRRSFIVVSSLDTALELLSRGILSFDAGVPRSKIDLYIDSADEVDVRKNMIKGGGGAMLKEKILTLLSAYRIFIVDETKLSQMIGEKKALPVEVAIYAYPYVIAQLSKLGYRAELRRSKTMYGPTITENYNVILDVTTGPINDPQNLDRTISSIPGVVVTGLFPASLCDEIIVGFCNGSVKIIT